MKYILPLLVALLLVSISVYSLDDSNFERNSLDRDIDDFYRLIPIDKVEKLYEEYKRDPEMMKALNYRFTDEFHNLLYAVEDLPEFHKYVLYLQEAGYDLIRELKLMHEMIGMEDYVPPKQSNEQLIKEARKGGVCGYLNDFIALLPKKKIQKLHRKKLKESPAFAKFNSYILSEKYTEIKKTLRQQKAVIELLEKSKANGLDLVAIENLKFYILGF